MHSILNPTAFNLSTFLAYACCFIAATHPDGEYHSLKAWCLLGAIVGGWIANVIFSEMTQVRERNFRWLVNVGAAFLTGLPFGRWVAQQMEMEFSSEFAIFGGGVSGVFAVSIFIGIKKLIPQIIDLILKLKFGTKE